MSELMGKLNEENGRVVMCGIILLCINTNMWCFVGREREREKRRRR